MIREARPGDVGTVAGLYERSFGTLSFLPTLHTLEEHHAWFGQVVAQREVWVWEEDGVILGFMMIIVFLMVAVGGESSRPPIVPRVGKGG